VPAQLRRENTEWCDVLDAKMPTRKTSRACYLSAIRFAEATQGNGAAAGRQSSCGPSGHLARICDPMLTDEVRSVLRNHRFACDPFNNGLHGIGYTDAEYETAMQRLLELMMVESRGARLILRPPRTCFQAGKAGKRTSGTASWWSHET